MQNNPPIVTIDLTPEYKRNLKQLAKKYRNIRSDLEYIIEELQKGNFLGDDYLDLMKVCIFIK